jgi:hypothetical protein
MKVNLLSTLLAASLLISACQSPANLLSEETLVGVNTDPVLSAEAPKDKTTEGLDDGTDLSEVEQTPSVTGDPTGEPLGEILNPLTGLPVENPENLVLPPALVSVTNFPPTARPQAGLSFSPLVFEIFIGDGMTRYLALFYGDFPQAAIPDQAGDAAEDFGEGVPQPSAVIGPVRSGRLPYEHIRKLFSGFIVMASAYSKVASQLEESVNIFGSDSSDVNSALIPVEKLEVIAHANQDELSGMNISGMSFDPQPPADGRKAQSLWIFYAYLNQVFWRYNAGDGSYHRWQDNADGSTFIEQTDRLTGDPLTFENVVVLFADHEVTNKYLIDIQLLYVKRGKALLFRDGVMQEIYWTTKSEEYEQTTGNFRPIRFIDVDGNPVDLKPGQTWVEIMPGISVYWETVNSEKYNQLASGRSKGSGYWGLYFHLDD